MLTDEPDLKRQQSNVEEETEYVTLEQVRLLHKINLLTMFKKFNCDHVDWLPATSANLVDSQSHHCQIVGLQD